ncbi:DUF1801 domain-containing protein [Arthrobacter rhombi]|uniref:DUF1801 domain-containing protein n=1 Tax=Arthrobacter rhombi TaxID=71253 RepID=UPI003FD0CF56
MPTASGSPAVMWGPRIIGFGACHFRYAAGREEDAPAIGSSPRASSWTPSGLTGPLVSADLCGALGKHRRGASCRYVSTLVGVDLGILRDLMDTGHHSVMSELHQP